MNAYLRQVKHLVLMGGGAILLDLAKSLTVREDIDCHLIIAPRHAGEILQSVKGSFTLSQHLEALNIPFHLVSDWRKSMEGVDMSCGIAISIGAPWIFKKHHIENEFQNRLFNAHGTRLPTYRGGGGFSWQILNGNRYGYAMLHQVSAGIDAGDIVACEEFLYPASCRIPLDYQCIYQSRVVTLLRTIITQAVDNEWRYHTISQPEYLSQYWPRLHTETQAWIDWSMPLESLERFICAFDTPYQGAQTLLNHKKLHLKSCLIDHHDGLFHPMQHGLVYRNNKKWLCIAANGGTLIVESIIDQNGQNVLPAIKVGDRFFTTTALLEQRFQSVQYNAEHLIKET